MSETIGTVIRRLREKQGLSQEQLSQLIDISRVSIGNYERGSREPEASTLAKLAKGLGVSKLYLYKVAGYLNETDIIEMADENHRFRKALEFYANKSNFITFDSPAIKDAGEIARKALEVTTCQADNK